MTKRRDAPLRTCVGCRTVRPQTELVRCAIGGDGRIVVDRRAPGRGAWLCGPDCVDLAERGRGFQRAWRRPVDPDAIERLRRTLAAIDHLKQNEHEQVGIVPRRCETDRPTKG